MSHWFITLFGARELDFSYILKVLSFEFLWIRMYLAELESKKASGYEVEKHVCDSWKFPISAVFIEKMTMRITRV